MVHTECGRATISSSQETFALRSSLVYIIHKSVSWVGCCEEIEVAEEGGTREVVL